MKGGSAAKPGSGKPPLLTGGAAAGGPFAALQYRLTGGASGSDAQPSAGERGRRPRCVRCRWRLAPCMHPALPACLPLPPTRMLPRLPFANSACCLQLLWPPAGGSRARSLVRTRIEPKTFFANERTFLQWLQIRCAACALFCEWLRSCVDTCDADRTGSWRTKGCTPTMSRRSSSCCSAQLLLLFLEC